MNKRNVRKVKWQIKYKSVNAKDKYQMNNNIKQKNSELMKSKKANWHINQKQMNNKQKIQINKRKMNKMQKMAN